MPRPRSRTRSRKRKTVRLPGGSREIFYSEEKKGYAKCSRCGRELTFLPRSTVKIRKAPKNQKKVSRMFSGQLCHICLQSLLKQTARTI